MTNDALYNNCNISACIITDGADLDKLFKAVRSCFSSCSEIVICANGKYEEVKFTFRNYSKVKVFPQVWEKDFSKARNEAIEKCKGDWIFIIDSDEELETPIKYLDGSFDVIDTQIQNFVSEDKTVIEQHSNYRLFRKDKDIKFELAIHESPLPDMARKQARALNNSGIIIKHSGYLGEEDIAIKSKRNTEMLLAMPDTIHRNYYLFRQYTTDQKYKEAIELGLDLLNSEQIDDALRAGICAMLATCYLFGYNAINEVKIMLILSIRYEPNQVYARLFLLEELARIRDIRSKELALQQVDAIETICRLRKSKLNADILFNKEHFEKLKTQIVKWQ